MLANIPRLTQFSASEIFSSGVYMLSKNRVPCRVSENGVVPMFHVQTQDPVDGSMARAIQKYARRKCRRSDLAARGAFSNYPDKSLFLEEDQLNSDVEIVEELSYGQIPVHTQYSTDSSFAEGVYMVGYRRRPCRVDASPFPVGRVFFMDPTDAPIADFLRRHSVGPCERRDFPKIRK